MLFHKYSILDLLPAQKQKLKEKIQSLKADYLLNASEQDLVAWLVGEFTLNVPTIDESKIEMDYREKANRRKWRPQPHVFRSPRPILCCGNRVHFHAPVYGRRSVL